MSDLQKDFIKTMCHNIEEIFPTLSSDTILFIACQAALESDYGNSPLCRYYHNYFGMRNPMTRPSTSKVRGLSQFEWADYYNCQYSIIDYFMCLSFHKPLSKELDNLELFKAFIRSWYCPEKNYLDKITKIFNQFKSLSHGKA